MNDLIKKTMLTGIGLALKTWDEVESLAKELVEKGKMSEKEGSKFLDELQKKYEESQNKLEARVQKSVKQFLKKMDVVTRDDLKALRREISELKKMVAGEKKKSQ
jgi:polyhydroxyalkanoate synthesis regulator phasin